MNDSYTQLKLNFEAVQTRAQHNEEHPLLRKGVSSSNVVQLRNVREQRERTKQLEEESVLMEIIRARVAHLQA
jgi:hypothetical protein